MRCSMVANQLASTTLSCFRGGGEHPVVPVLPRPRIERVDEHQRAVRTYGGEQLADLARGDGPVGAKIQDHHRPEQAGVGEPLHDGEAGA